MNTPKIIVVFISLIFTFSASAQKVKVKKNEILIDKNPVAKFEDYTDDNDFDYAIVTLEDEKLLEIDFNKEIVGPEEKKEIFQWLVLKQPNNDKTNKINFRDLTFSLNTKKLIVLYLMKKHNMFNENGVIRSSIEEFFASETKSEDEIGYKKYLKREEGFKELLAQIQPYVKPDLETIIKGGGAANEPIGRIVAPDKYKDIKTVPVKVYDLDENLIATATTEMLAPVTVNLMDRSTFTYTSSSQGDSKYAEFLTQLVEQIVSKGYALGHEISEKQAAKSEALNEKYEKAKANSSNIYNQKGYLIDKEGKKWEGDISLAFEEVKNPADWGGVVDISSYGNSLGLRYINEKDKKKFKSFSAKDGVRFCLTNEDGSETCYQGVKIQSNGLMAKATTASGNRYVKEILKEGKIVVYQSLPGNEYVIKTDSQEKAFSFVFGDLIKEEKKVVKLKEYLNGCESGNGKFDEASFENIDKVKELINFYNTSCK